MDWYWNMKHPGRFFLAQFMAIYVIGYLIGGIVWDSWATVPGVIVPMWPGIAANLGWTFYNVLHI